MFLLQVHESVNTDFISTLVKPETQLRNTFSTRLFVFEPDKFKTFARKPGILQGVVTQVKDKEFRDNSSSFEEYFYDDFDINSKFIYKKSYKLKVKVKSITKFSPQIILD